jgi:hypothetical protein
MQSLMSILACMGAIYLSNRLKVQTGSAVLLRGFMHLISLKLEQMYWDGANLRITFRILRTRIFYSVGRPKIGHSGHHFIVGNDIG